jgi:hypothetical protein
MVNEAKQEVHKNSHVNGTDGAADKRFVVLNVVYLIRILLCLKRLKMCAVP